VPRSALFDRVLGLDDFRHIEDDARRPAGSPFRQ
jgi:hypothetical protein